MDYLGILKKAYEITIKHRYLWIFAILAGGAGASKGFDLSLPNSTSYSDKWDKYFTGNNTVGLEHFWTQYWGVLVAIAGIIILLAFFWTIFSIISQGALLGSVEAIEKQEKYNFKTGFVYGWHKFWRVLVTGVLVGLFVFLSIIVLALPIILFVLAKIYVLAIIYGILVFLLDLFFWLYIGLMYPYILRSAVLGDISAWEAIISSWDFFKKHWKEILVTYFLLMAVGIVVGIAILLILLIVGGLLFAIGFALYLASQFIFWTYAVIFSLAFIVLIMVLSGIVNSFSSSVLTLVYLELVKNGRKD